MTNFSRTEESLLYARNMLVMAYAGREKPADYDQRIKEIDHALRENAKARQNASAQDDVRGSGY